MMFMRLCAALALKEPKGVGRRRKQVVISEEEDAVIYSAYNGGEIERFSLSRARGLGAVSLSPSSGPMCWCSW